jgi:tripartite-type tricarboxylate transporter receptor subunit TctC
VRKRLAALDAEPAGGSVGEFTAFLKSERVKWSAVVRDAGIKPDS